MTAPDREIRGRRIVVHAGFHKTGTTTIQNFLQHHGPVLWPHTALALPFRLRKGAARAARRYDDSRSPAALDELSRELTALFDSLSLGLHRRLLLSDESLSGRMPGYPGVTAYEAAVPLMERIAGAITDFYPDPDLTFILTTRAPDAWLRSTWKHAVRHARVTEDFPDFAARQRPGADLSGLTDTIRKALSPLEVVESPLETAALLPLGPAQPVVDLLALPPSTVDQLRPAPPANPGPSDDAVAEMLRLNRSGLAGEALEAAKAALDQD